MSFLIFGLFVIVVSILSYYRKRHTNLQQKADQDFWTRESAANSVRRKDISGLSYINIPFELFSIASDSDAVLNDALKELESLRDKRILNLGRQTNTDLKLQYGPANLPALMEYDQNYSDMLHLISVYSNRLIELNRMADAIPLLEFAINCGSDVSSHYTTLAGYYKDTNDTAKFISLKERANALDSIMQDAILEKINAIEAES